MASKGNAALQAMIEEATIDAYGDDEQLTGLFTMIEEHLAVPFTTTVLGVEVTVRKIDLTADTIVAVCARAATGRGSTCLTCRYPHRRPTAPGGSTPTGTGPEGRPR